MTKTGTLFGSRSAGKMHYIGMDKMNNYYWYYSGLLVVHNSAGRIIENFIFPEMNHRLVPAVHPNGDVYFLDHDQEKTYLYKIAKHW